MSKQNTILIFDVSSSMSETLAFSKAGEAITNSIVYGLNIIASKMISGKKSEQVGIVTFHDTDSGNSMYEETKHTEDEAVNWANCVFHTPRRFDWSTAIKMRQDWIKTREEDFDYKDEADVPRALAITFNEIRKMNPYSGNEKIPKRKETYNIVLFTDFQNKCSWEGLDDMLIELASIYDCQVGLIYANHGQAEYEVFKQNLLEATVFVNKLKELNGKVSYSYIADLLSAQKELGDWSSQPTKVVKPMATFKGEIRIGCDLDSLDLINCLAELNYHGGNEDTWRPDYDKKNDSQAIIFSAEGYPLTKNQTVSVTKEIGVKSATSQDAPEKASKYRLLDLSRSSEKFYTLDETIMDPKNSEDTDNIRYITDESNLEERFKYGSTALLISTALEEQINLPVYQGIDIIRLVDKYSIPPWYYSHETTIILPEQNSTLRDKLVLDSLCQALLKNNLVAVCRVVMKTQKEVVTAALIPSVILTETTKSNSSFSESVSGILKRSADQLESEDTQVDHYGFTLARLPFKDDEKLSNTKNLKLVADEGSKTSIIEEFPTTKMLDSMDRLVESMDLDRLNGIEDERIIEDRFVELNQFFPVATPSAEIKGLIEPGLRKSLNAVTRKLLNLNSPKVHVLATIIRIFYAAVLSNSEDPEASLFDMVGIPGEGFSTEDQEELHKTLELFFDETSKGDFIPKLYDHKRVKNNLSIQKLVEELKAQFNIKKQNLLKLSNKRAKDQSLRVAEEAISLNDLINMG